MSKPRTRDVLLLVGLLAVLAVPGRALLPHESLLPLDFLHQALLPWANDVRSPSFVDHYEIDALQEHLPSYHFHAERLRHGDFPTWNPYNRGGAAYPDNPVRLPLHPLKVLLAFLPPAQMADLLAVIHFALAFLSMACYLRALRLAGPAVLFGAVCWAFSGFFVLNFIHERMIAGIGLLPLCLLLLERLWVQPGARATLRFGAVLGGALLVSGPTAILIYLLVFSARLAGFWLFESAPPGRSRIGWLLAAGLLGVCLAGPNLLSMIQGLLHNVRVFEYEGAYALGSPLLTTLAGYLGLALSTLHPWALGSRDSIDVLKVVDQTIRLTPFAGSYTVLFVLLAVSRLRRAQHLRWLLLLAVLGAVLLLPPIAHVLSTRNVILLTLVLVILAASGMDLLWSASAATQRRPARLVIVAALLLWGLFALRELVLQRYAEQILQLLHHAIEARLPGYLLERYAQWKLASAERFLALQHIWAPPNLAFLLGLTLLALAWRGFAARGRPWARAAVCGLATLAPVLYAIDQVHVVDTHRYPVPQRPPYLDLRGPGPGPARIAIPQGGRDDRLLMPALLPQLFGLAQVRGYGSLMPLGPAVLTRGLPLDHPLFEVLGVDYLITARDSPVRLAAYPRDVYHGEVNIYARAAPVSRFHFASRLQQAGSRRAALELARADRRSPARRSFYLTELPPRYRGPASAPGGPIVVQRDDPDLVELRTGVRRGALLVIGTTFYPGWQASVNGRRTRIYAVDGSLQGIWLPAGEADVQLRYVHWPTRIGVLLQIAALLASAGFLLRLLRAHRGARRGPG